MTRHRADGLLTASAEFVDPLDKALWPIGERVDPAEFAGAGHTLFDGSISWPAMVLRADALDHNIAALARFCADHDLDFAPHGKTTMAPALFRRQLRAGAWGITVATAQQAQVARAAGVRRVLLANELLDSTALAYLAVELAADPTFEFYCLVDSAEGVRAAAAAGRETPSRAGFPLLLDIGYDDGRTGVRTAAQALDLARAIAAADGVVLRGVSAYEGGLGGPDAVRDYFGAVRSIVEELTAAGLVPDTFVVTAGGSAYFDLVATELGGEWAKSVGAQVILRSGAYITHDNGIYARKTAYGRIPSEGSLHPAIELWAQVISAPQAGLAFAGMGKRDAPYDDGMPVPLRVRRAADGRVDDISRSAHVPKMDDQHCYLTLADGLVLRPGDLVCFGISHPCTAFDKWRAVPIVDRTDRIVDVVRTYF